MYEEPPRYNDFPEFQEFPEFPKFPEFPEFPESSEIPRTSETPKARIQKLSINPETFQQSRNFPAIHKLFGDKCNDRFAKKGANVTTFAPKMIKVTT